MTQLYELMDLEQLQDEIDGGFVSEREHPEYPNLRILNYTPEAQFSHRWNDVTRKTRGLIFDTRTSTVLARPFPKIHNWDEPEAPPFLAENAPVYAVGNKFDGSLGILYRLPNGRPAIATRGSFVSEQAIRATMMLHDSGMAWVMDEWVDEGYTPLFEIIYPENRIVLSYGDESFLQPLGMVHIATGAYVPPTEFARDGRTFHEVRMDLSRPNSEGWVVWRDEFTAVKIKQADYVELHRIVTGLNRKSVWRALREGTLVKLMDQLPDELYGWANGVAEELLVDHAGWMKAIRGAYEDLVDRMGGRENFSQKEFALEVQASIEQTYRGYMFSLHAGRDIADKLWAELEPVGGDR